MKKGLALFCVIILILNSCSKSESTTPDPNNNTLPACKVISGALIINNDTISSFNRFDGDGKLVRSVSYYSESDSTITNYTYEGDKISAILRPTDSSYYVYDKYGQLSSKTSMGGSNDGRTDKFFYNEVNKVVKTKVWYLINSSEVLADSTIYTWVDDNIVSSVKKYTPTFSNWITLTLNYTYDDKVNSMKLSGLPPSEFRGWSKNNLMKSTVVDHPELTYTITYLEYNASGLPTIYTWQSGQSNYKSITNYHCN